MGPGEFEKQKQRVNKFIKKWHEPAGFDWWEVVYEWEKEYDRDDRTAARCRTNWEYRTAVITFYLPEISHMTDREIENCVVHELSHVLVGPIQDYSSEESKQMTEFTVQNVSQALRWAAQSVKRDKDGK